MTAPTLAPIHPDRVREVWPAVRERLAALRESCGERWLPEDIYVALTAKPTPGAYLWATDDMEGFIVFQVEELPWGRNLFLWATCNDTAARAAEYWPQVMDLAAKAECQRARIESPRRGWARELPGAKVRYIYEFEVGGDG